MCGDNITYLQLDGNNYVIAPYTNSQNPYTISTFDDGCEIKHQKNIYWKICPGFDDCNYQLSKNIGDYWAGGRIFYKSGNYIYVANFDLIGQFYTNHSDAVEHVNGFSTGWYDQVLQQNISISDWEVATLNDYGLMAAAFQNNLMNSNESNNTTGYMTAIPDQYFFMNNDASTNTYGPQNSWWNYRVIMVRRVPISMSCYYY